jgi:ABC-type glutathione transport system ATPase component
MADRIVLDGLQVSCGPKTLVQDASLTVCAGQVVGLVGASGSGKTLTARSLLGMVPQLLTVQARLQVHHGAIVHQPYEGPPGGLQRRFRALRGPVLGLLPQDAGNSLDPFRTVGALVRRAARGADPSSFLERAGFRSPDASLLGSYPHELSGGMAQRVALATVLATGSRFIIADEPTTGLDASVQRQLVLHLSALARDEGLGVLVVSHDLRWLGALAHAVHVMHEGRLVETFETAPTSEAGRRLYAAAQRLRSVGFP